MKITKDTVLEKVLSLPNAGEILVKHKVPCLGCPMAAYEMGSLKMGDIAKMYGINLKKLLEDLNKLVKK